MVEWLSVVEKGGSEGSKVGQCECKLLGSTRLYLVNDAGLLFWVSILLLVLQLIDLSPSRHVSR